KHVVGHFGDFVAFGEVGERLLQFMDSAVVNLFQRRRRLWLLWARGIIGRHVAAAYLGRPCFPGHTAGSCSALPGRRSSDQKRLLRIPLQCRTALFTLPRCPLRASWCPPSCLTVGRSCRATGRFFSSALTPAALSKLSLPRAGTVHLPEK